MDVQLAVNPRDRNPINAIRIILSEADRRALRESRRRRKIRVKVLARALGVHPQTIMLWQSGRRRPMPDDLARWRAAVLP